MIIYTEKQKFNIFLRLLLLIPFFILIYGLYQQIFLKISFGDKPLNTNIFILFTFFYLLFLLFFNSLTLTTKITNKEINISFPPFFTNKIYKWSDIKNIKCVKYNPLRSYLGWGVRINKNSYAYTTKGNLAIEIETYSTSKKILIGTQNPDEILKIIKDFKKK